VESENCYLKVVVRPNGSDTTYRKRIVDILMQHNGSLPIGKNITAQMANTWLDNLSQYVTVLDVELSMDGVTFNNTTNVKANKYLVFSAETISFDTGA
jgi:hypothetical protein